MEFLLNLPPRVFERVAGFRNMYSGGISPIPDYETEDTPCLLDGWTVEDALRIIGLCAMLNSLNERDRGVALDAIMLANTRYYHVLKHEYYVKFFTGVIDAAEPPDRDPIILTFSLTGYGWHATAIPRYRVNTDAALAAFREALKQPG